MAPLKERSVCVELVRDAVLPVSVVMFALFAFTVDPVAVVKRRVVTKRSVPVALQNPSVPIVPLVARRLEPVALPNAIFVDVTFVMVADAELKDVMFPVFARIALDVTAVPANTVPEA